jgi:hypothetical protein
MKCNDADSITGSTGSAVASCGHGNEPSTSIKGQEYFNQLSNCLLSKSYCIMELLTSITISSTDWYTSYLEECLSL